MFVQKDYDELLKLFNKNKVKYCIIGAYAVAFYGRPKYTKDMDILVEPSPENAKRIVKSLVDFGFKSLGLAEKDFSLKGRIIQLGYEPVRVDIITSGAGCNFDDAWKDRVTGKYGKQKVFFIGKSDLIRTKLASGRKQDKEDADLLLKSVPSHPPA